MGCVIVSTKWCLMHLSGSLSLSCGCPLSLALLLLADWTKPSRGQHMRSSIKPEEELAEVEGFMIAKGYEDHDPCRISSVPRPVCFSSSLLFTVPAASQPWCVSYNVERESLYRPASAEEVLGQRDVGRKVVGGFLHQAAPSPTIWIPHFWKKNTNRKTWAGTRGDKSNYETTLCVDAVRFVSFVRLLKWSQTSLCVCLVLLNTDSHKYFFLWLPVSSIQLLPLHIDLLRTHVDTYILVLLLQERNLSHAQTACSQPPFLSIGMTISLKSITLPAGLPVAAQPVPVPWLYFHMYLCFSFLFPTTNFYCPPDKRGWG